MQNLIHRVIDDEMFDLVIWVTVSRYGTMENEGIDVSQQKIKVETIHSPSGTTSF